MNGSLKTQIIVRILPLLVFTILVMTIIVIQSAVSANRIQYQQRIHEVVDLIRNSRFPKTDGILENMKSLSGAEFVTVGDQGDVVSRTQGAPTDFDFGELNQRQSKFDLSDAIGSGKNRFYHSCIPAVGSESRAPQSKFIHVFVPAEDYRKTWWSSVKLPLLLAAVVIPLAVILCFAMANQVTRPLVQLRTQVEKIAEAEFDQSSSSRNEIASLKFAIENMTARLAEHEQNVRQNQRLETMVQIGNGVAHNLRNCATGCKMAVELLANENRDLSQSENLAVAKRQLALMNQYISQFLNLGASTGGSMDSSKLGEKADLVEVLQEAVFLLKPSAEHLGIDLVIKCDLTSLPVDMNREDAAQLMTNLIKNAIEATSHQKAVAGIAGRVEAELTFAGGEVKFEVTDTGPGPSVELQSKLFEPFVTGKQEGTGLGLPLVRQIAEGMGGHVTWDREEGLTRFTVQFSIENQRQ